MFKLRFHCSNETQRFLCNNEILNFGLQEAFCYMSRFGQLFFNVKTKYVDYRSCFQKMRRSTLHYYFKYTDKDVFWN